MILLVAAVLVAIGLLFNLVAGFAPGNRVGLQLSGMGLAQLATIAAVFLILLHLVTR